MNEIPVRHPLVGSNPGTRRVAEPRPDQSFLEAVEALLGRVGTPPSPDGDPGTARRPMGMPADPAPESAGSEFVAAAETAEPMDLSLLVMPQSAPSGHMNEGPVNPDSALAPPAVVEPQSIVPTAPAEGRQTRAVAGPTAPPLPIGPSFVPPVEAAVPTPAHAIAAVDAALLAAEGNLPERTVAVVTRVETHFAPVAIPQVTDPRIPPPKLQIGVRPEPARTGTSRTIASAMSAERRSDAPAVPAPPFGTALSPDPKAAPAATVPAEDGVAALPPDLPEASHAAAPRRERARFDPPPALRPDRPASPPAEPVRPEPAAATVSAASVQSVGMPERLAGSDMPRVTASLAGALRGPAEPSPLASAPQPGPLRIVALTLDPEHLGRVKLTIRLTGERLSLHIVAERPETAEMIEHDAEALTRLLGAEGFDIESLTATPLRETAGVLPPQPSFSSGSTFGDPGADGNRPASQQAHEDGQRRPPRHDTNEQGSAPHEEADASGRDGRLYV